MIDYNFFSLLYVSCKLSEREKVLSDFFLLHWPSIDSFEHTTEFEHDTLTQIYVS